MLHQRGTGISFLLWQRLFEPAPAFRGVRLPDDRKSQCPLSQLAFFPCPPECRAILSGHGMNALSHPLPAWIPLAEPFATLTQDRKQRFTKPGRSKVKSLWQYFIRKGDLMML